MKHLAIALLFFAPTLAAEDACRTSTNALRPECIHAAAGDPTAESPIQGSNLGARFEATRDKAKVDAFLGYEFTDSEAAYLKVSSAIKDQEQQKTFSNLSGLANGTSVTAGMYSILFAPSADVHAQDVVCDEYKASADYKTNPANPADPKEFQCSIGTLPEPYKTRYKKTINWGPTPKIGGIQVTANTNEFKYFKSDYSSTKESHTGYGIAAGFGRFPLGRVHYLGLNVAYENSYKAGDDANICVPVPNATATKCQTLAVGAPTKKTNFIGTVELRAFFGTRAGIIPRVHYEFKKRDVSVELPVYFLHDADGGFNGGVTFGWQPEAKGPAFTASMFFGVLSRAGRFWE